MNYQGNMFGKPVPVFEDCAAWFEVNLAYALNKYQHLGLVLMPLSNLHFAELEHH